jgi:hypothetical protein
MSEHKTVYECWMRAAEFLSSLVSIYSISDGVLDLIESESQFLAFFSRDFLRERAWSVVPLWEGDLRSLKFEDGRAVSLTKMISDYCKFNAVACSSAASVEKAQWPYTSGAAALTISHKTFDVDRVDLGYLFENSPENMPYWGHTFIWPEDKRFVVYTNGDNAAFISGDLEFLEGMLGFSYSYAMKRFVEQNSQHDGWCGLVGPYTAFCDEFKNV